MRTTPFVAVLQSTVIEFMQQIVTRSNFDWIELLVAYLEVLMTEHRWAKGLLERSQQFERRVPLLEMKVTCP